MCSVTLVECDSATPRTASLQSPLSMGFSRQESWSRLPCWPPGNPSNPEIEPEFLTPPALAGGFFITSATWEAHPGETDLKRNAHGGLGLGQSLTLGAHTAGCKQSPWGEGQPVPAGAAAKGLQRPRGAPPAASHRPSAPRTPPHGPHHCDHPGARDCGAGGHLSDLTCTLGRAVSGSEVTPAPALLPPQAQLSRCRFVFCQREC